MTRPVVIVGPMRSGTSMVAEVVHRLGWQVAVAMGAPVPPRWRADWEDLSLSVPVLRGDRPRADWLRGYLDRRRIYSERMGFGGRFALKSPYLALVWYELAAAFGEERPFIIKTERAPADIKRSMADHPSLSRKDQAKILAALVWIEGDLVVRYEDATADPLTFAGTVAAALGVLDDDATVRAAAALVGPRTEYASCRS